MVAYGNHIGQHIKFSSFATLKEGEKLDLQIGHALLQVLSVVLCHHV